MTYMTLNQFKEMVDRKIKEKGIPDDVPIEYIDISYPCKDNPSCTPRVYYSEGTLAISQ